VHGVEEHVLALMYSNHNIDFWDIKDLSNIKFIKRRDAHSGPIISVSNTHTDSVFTCSEDGTICLWDIETKDDQTLVGLKKRLVTNSDVHSSKYITSDAVAVCRIHGKVALGDNLGMITLYNLNDPTEEFQNYFHNSGIRIISFSGSFE